MIGGGLLLMRDGTGAVFAAVCVPGGVVSGARVTPREACWIDQVTGEVYVNHRHNSWCCVPLSEAFVVPASSSGTRLSWETSYRPNDLGVAAGAFGVLLVAVLVAWIFAVIAS